MEIWCNKIQMIIDENYFFYFWWIFKILVEFAIHGDYVNERLFERISTIGSIGLPFNSTDLLP